MCFSIVNSFNVLFANSQKRSSDRQGVSEIMDIEFSSITQ